jgi:hypothetical protein
MFLVSVVVDGELALTALSSSFYLSLFNVLVRSVERQLKLRESLLTCSIADKASTCFKTHSDHSFFFFFLFSFRLTFKEKKTEGEREQERRKGRKIGKK